jgi:hypothetical protein
VTVRIMDPISDDDIKKRIQSAGTITARDINDLLANRGLDERSIKALAKLGSLLGMPLNDGSKVIRLAEVSALLHVCDHVVDFSSVIESKKDQDFMTSEISRAFARMRNVAGIKNSSISRGCNARQKNAMQIATALLGKIPETAIAINAMKFKNETTSIDAGKKSIDPVKTPRISNRPGDIQVPAMLEWKVSVPIDAFLSHPMMASWQSEMEKRMRSAIRDEIVATMNIHEVKRAPADKAVQPKPLPPTIIVPKKHLVLVDLNNLMKCAKSCGRYYVSVFMDELMKMLFKSFSEACGEMKVPINADDVFGYVIHTKSLENLKRHIDGEFGIGEEIGLKEFPGKLEWVSTNAKKISHGEKIDADVDTIVVDKAAEAMLKGMTRVIDGKSIVPGEIAWIHLASGDKDLHPVVARAKRMNIPVSIISYKHSIAMVMKNDAHTTYTMD